MFNVCESVSRVRVSHELDLRKAFPDLADDLNVPARLDLHLDPLVSGLHLVRDLVQQMLNAVLDADRYPARDFPPRASTDSLPQRLLLQPCLQVPNGSFDAALGHIVPADLGAQRQYVRGLVELSMKHARS